MKPNLRTFVEYIKKYPDKRICLRMLYKDYKVNKDERDKWRQAFDFVVENLNARRNGEEVAVASQEEGIEGQTQE